MATSLERAAIVFDRKGHAVPQGILHAEEFNHLIGSHIEIEKKEPTRELIMWSIFNIFDDMLNESDSDQKFISLMSQAMTEAQNSQGKGKIKLMGRLYDNTFISNNPPSFEIHSRPRTRAIRIIIQDELDESLIELSKDNINIKTREYPKRKFRKMTADEFLWKYYDPDDILDTETGEDKQYNSVHATIGRGLDETIFYPKRGLQSG